LPHESDIYAVPARIPTPETVFSEEIPSKPSLDPLIPFPAKESEAQHRLAGFITTGIEGYAQQRNRMDLDGTSQLSPYLRFGLLSPRAAAVAAISAREEARTDNGRAGATSWLNELIWREFYIHILYHFPHVLHTSFRENLRDIAWRNDEVGFAAWCAGQTGYPVVDAAMRQLMATGWMHNRARMIVASFLVKDLLIDWRWGEKWFMQQLIDGDPAANSGGWQWTAGTGTDAAPYFRIFNPTTQGYKFDPDGDYVRRWVPELSNVFGPAIHEPQLLTPLEQRTAGVIIGQDYPTPIVDHRIARGRTLAAFAAAKEAGA
jgi:deoxyribodipyrimidine photo-lyase